MAVLRKKPSYCYSLGVILVRHHCRAKTLTFCNISGISEDTYLKLEYVFIIQGSIHAMKGDNSKCIFLQDHALRLFILYQAPHSVVSAPACGALVISKLQHKLLHSTIC